MIYRGLNTILIHNIKLYIIIFFQIICFIIILIYLTFNVFMQLESNKEYINNAIVGYNIYKPNISPDIKSVDVDDLSDVFNNSFKKNKIKYGIIYQGAEMFYLDKNAALVLKNQKFIDFDEEELNNNDSLQIIKEFDESKCLKDNLIFGCEFNLSIENNLSMSNYLNDGSIFYIIDAKYDVGKVEKIFNELINENNEGSVAMVNNLGEPIEENAFTIDNSEVSRISALLVIMLLSFIVSFIYLSKNALKSYAILFMLGYSKFKLFSIMLLENIINYSVAVLLVIPTLILFNIPFYFMQLFLIFVFLLILVVIEVCIYLVFYNEKRLSYIIRRGDIG